MKYNKPISPASVLGARYTIFIRSLVDSGYDFGLDDFPIWDDAYRRTLFNKIIEHYMYQEIGFETPELFKHYINLALNEIMPYYNQLYLTTLYQLDPFLEFKHDETSKRITDVDNKLNSDIDSKTNSDVDTTSNSDVDTTSNSNVDNSSNNLTDNDTDSQQNTITKSTINDVQTSNGKNISSDTPQNLLASGSIEENKWATQADINNVQSSGTNTGDSSNDTHGTNKNKITEYLKNNIITDSKDTVITQAKDNVVTTATNNVSTISENTIDTTDDYVRSLSGFNSHPALNIEKIRATLINIDLEIINHEEIKTCFMGVY